jgi:cephalosporin-C deacetylase
MPPTNISRFWDETLTQLAETPMDATTQTVTEWDDHTLSTTRVSLTSFGKIKISAWYTFPKGTPPQQGWPAVMVLPGYGGDLVLPGYHARFGYATLNLFPRGQGESIQHWQLDRDTKATYNVTDREHYYYRGAFADCVRGLDYLCCCPEIDRSRLSVWGASQGGGLALVTAALDNRPKAVVAALPWLCNFPVSVNLTTAPYSELNDYISQHPWEREIIMENLSYFDALNLVDGIACPTMVGVSAIDEVHPYDTVMPVFEKIHALKSLVVYHDTDHGHYVDFSSRGMTWLERYLK